MSRKSRKPTQRRKPIAVPSVEQIQAHDLIDIGAVCVLVGGTKPVNKATVYRGVAAGRLPKPVMVTPNSARWVRSEVLGAIQGAIAARA